MHQSLALCLCMLPVGGALAQSTFPARPVNFIVPYEAGGASDINARIVGQEMAKTLGQPVIIENKPGATGLIGEEQVARSTPDGYTIGFIATPGVLAYYQQNKPFDMARTFTPVGQMYSQYTLMVVNPAAPEMANVQDLQQFLAVAKANPGKLDFTSIGPASVGHLTMERVLKLAGVKMEHVPYKGQTPALNDVLAGRVPMMSGTLSISSYVKGGKLRAIAVAAPKRAQVFPDVKTVEEQGFPGVIGGSFVGVVAPPGTPAPQVQRLTGALKEAVNGAEFGKRMAVSSADPEYLGPAEFAARANRDYAQWTQVVKDSGIQLQ